MIPRKSIRKKTKNEQKEVLQALQSDIQDMKEHLQEIRVAQDGASKFTAWCALGGVGATAGLAIIGIGVSSEICYLVLHGFFMFLAGMLMIKGACDAETNINKYPYLGIKLLKLRDTNKWLLCGFLLLVIDIFILFVLYIPCFIISRLSFIP